MEFERYDIQFVFETAENYRAEEVIVLSNYAQRNLRLAYFPLRPAQLQVGWQAIDGDGKRLIILSRAELDVLHGCVFSDAITYFKRRRDLPDSLHRVIHSDDWARELELLIARVKEDTAEWQVIFSYFQAVSAKFPENLGPQQESVGIFIEYVGGRVAGFYRPWVYLNQPLAATSPDWEKDVQDKVLVKFSVDERLRSRWWEKLLLATFGWIHLKIEFPWVADASSHLRICAPRGTVFSSGIKPPAGISKWSWTREKAQFLVDERSGTERLEKLGGDVVTWTVRLVHPIHTRLIAAVLLAVLTLTPILLSLGRIGGSAPLLARDVLATVSAEDLRLAGSLALPLALMLLGAGWDRPAVRGFAVLQLIVAIVIVVAIAGAPLVPQVAVGLVGLGLLLAVYHSMEALLALIPLPPDNP